MKKVDELIEKKEYNENIFFHGFCLENKVDHSVANDLFLNIDEIISTYTKFSRYCIAGKYNYVDNVLELGISMIEYPYPYVRKKAREVALNNLNEKNYFSINIPFKTLNNVVGYSLGTEIRSFNELNQILKYYRRGSLMNFFISKKLSKLVS